MPTPATERRKAQYPVHVSVPRTAIHSLALDSAAMLDLHEWLHRRRFRLFGNLRPWDQQDAVHETFIRTLEFADKIRDPGALYAACFTIGLRVRAQRIAEYIQERCSAPPGVVPLVPWHPERKQFERDRHKGALLAIRSLQASDQEILLRFYFNGQTPQQIQVEFQVRKSRAISRARLCASAILANFRISHTAETVSATLNAPQPPAPVKGGSTS